MAASENRDEAGMIAAVLAGDTEAFHELIRPYERSVYRMALSFMKDKADAEDVAQEAFLRAFRKLSGFRAEAKFSTWLISITLNEARSRLRRQAAKPTASLDQGMDEGGILTPALLRDWREVPLEALEREEVRLMLEQAIEALPTIYHEVFLLRDVEGLSVDETARVLSISIANVKVRLHRARMMLQKRLAPRLKDVHAKRRWLPW